MFSALYKWYLKYTDRPAYAAYKQKRSDTKYINRISKVPLTLPQTHSGATVRVKHSGNSGDIIYSLPAAFALANNKPVEFFLHSNQPINNKNLSHPLGNVMLNDRMIEMLKPLLLYQPQIESVENFSGGKIDYDLDLFRSNHLQLDRGSIVRWYFLTHGVSRDTSHPWLVAPKDEKFFDAIVIARSQRYRSPLVNYSFLEQYSNKLFIGIPEEYEEMKKELPDLRYEPVTDFLQMATIINSCRLFIGNQSFPFSIAEALKVNRLLEVYYKAPNVIVEGRGGHDFMLQPQFEQCVKRLLQE